MSEKYYRQEPPVIGPGLCPPEGCPPPTRIECISVDKVYDSCFQVDERTRTFTVHFTGGLLEGDVIPCRQKTSTPVTCREISRTDVGGGFFNVVMAVSVPLVLTNPKNPSQTAHEVITITKTVTLCCPPEATTDCSDTTIVSCACVVTEHINDDNFLITCDVQVCIVVKCLLTVQLLVPSYGFCTPAPCVALPGVCPPAPPTQCF